MKALAALFSISSSSLYHFPGHHVSIRGALLHALGSGCTVSPTRSQWMSQTALINKHFSTLLRSNMLSPNLNTMAQKDVKGKEGNHVDGHGRSLLRSLYSGCSQATWSKQFSTLNLPSSSPNTLPQKEKSKDVKGKEGLFVYVASESAKVAEIRTSIPCRTAILFMFSGIITVLVLENSIVGGIGREFFTSTCVSSVVVGFYELYLRWLYSAYIHRLRWQPGSDRFEVEMIMSSSGGYTTRTIKLADIKPPWTLTVRYPFTSRYVDHIRRPMVTFMANGEPYYLEREQFNNKELLAKLDLAPH